MAQDSRTLDTADVTASEVPLPSSRTGYPSLKWFAVFNPNISHGEESAEDNILWFHPPSTPVDDQLRSIGLCSAFTCFSDMFGCEQVQSFETDGSRVVMVQAEPDFWFACSFTRREDGRVLSGESRDQGTADAARRTMSMGHSAFCMTSGTLTSCFTRCLTQARAEDAADAAAAQRPPKREKHLKIAAATRMRAGLLAHGVDMSVRLATAVASPRGSVGVRDGLEFLSVDGVGHLNIGSFARRLHNAHPGTVSHSVMLLANKVAFSTLPHATTATLLDFISKAESEHRRSNCGLRPEAVYLLREGRFEAVRGDAVAALRMAAAGQNQAPVSQQPVDSSPGRDLFRRLHKMLGSEEGNVATATNIFSAGNHAVIAYNASTRCYIEDRPLGLLCFRQGDFSLYCLVDEKFVEHDAIRAGLTDNVAAILMEEAAALDVAQHVAAETTAKGRRLENEVVFYYSNSANLAWKSSAHVKADNAGRSELLEQVDNVRHSALVRDDEYASLATRATDTAWAFVDRHGGREFCFGFGNERPVWSPTDAFRQADDVRRVALVGLSVD